jgi:hypothetical protein
MGEAWTDGERERERGATGALLGVSSIPLALTYE